MIDWFSIIATGMWIFGLSLALAAFSYAGWQASWIGDSLRTQLARGEVQNTFNWAGIFFCAGLAAASQRWWEKGLWVLLAVVFLGQFLIVWLNDRKSHYLKS